MSLGLEVPVRAFFGRMFVGVGPRLSWMLWADSHFEGVSSKPVDRSTALRFVVSVGGWLP